MKTPGDPRNTYLASLQWTGDSRAVSIQQLNRLQNRNDCCSPTRRRGEVRTRDHGDADATWVETCRRRADGRRRPRVPVAERARRLAARLSRRARRRRRSCSRSSTPTSIDVAGVDERAAGLYFLASPDNADAALSVSRAARRPRRRRARDAGRRSRARTPIDISPDGRWRSIPTRAFDAPPAIEVIELPDPQAGAGARRTTPRWRRSVGGAEPRRRSSSRSTSAAACTLDGWMLKPAASIRPASYPVIVYVYGEPASQTVDRSLGRQRARCSTARSPTPATSSSASTIAARRRRKARRGARSIYGTVGELVVEGAGGGGARARGERSRTSITIASGIWGWSGGGSNTLNAMFRFPDVFKVGVVGRAGAGSEALRHDLPGALHGRAAGATPTATAAARRSISPRVCRGKLLIVHGSGDDNVHYQGTERLVNRLVELGKPFDLMVYPNRTHAISEGAGHQPHVYSADRALLPRASAAGPSGAWRMSKITLKVNGSAHTVDVDPCDAAALHPAQRPRPAGPALRLRTRPVRRVHGDHQRRGGALVHHAGVGGQGRDHHARRARARTASCTRCSRPGSTSRCRSAASARTARS